MRADLLGVEDGLSQGFVTTLIQDKRGFIWLGTYDGLNRYDGYTVRRFTTKPFNPWSLQSTFITSLYEDDQQLLWVGTHLGLQVFDPLTERFFNLSLPAHNLPANHVSKIVGDKYGNIFVHIQSENNPSGLFRLQIPPDFSQQLHASKKALVNFRAEPVGAPASLVPPCMLLDCYGDTMPLLYDQTKAIFRYSYAKRQLQRFDPKELPGYSTDDHNILWGKYSGKFFRWQLPDGRDTVPPVDTWMTVVRMKDGNLGIWFYGKGLFYRKNTREPFSTGISFYKGELFKKTAFKQEVTLLLDGKIDWNNQVLVDRDGIIWAGTGGLGVQKTNPSQFSFGGLLSGKSISSLRELPDGLIWIRLYNDESFVLNASTGQKESPPWKINDWLFEVFSDRNGDYWLVEASDPTHNNYRLLKYEKSKGKITRCAESFPLVSAVPEKVFEDRDGNIWLAAHQGGLLRFRPGSLQAERFSYAKLATNNPLSLRTTSIIQDKNGVIWVGTNRGLLRMNLGNSPSPVLTFLKHDPDNPQTISIDWITSICVDPNDLNILWLGTRGGGLNRLNTLTQTFSFLSETPNGLPDNVVYGILPDDNGNLWCSTNRGLCRFNPLKQTFTSYQESDGLLNTEFNTNAYLRTRDGRLWFGGVKGLNVFRSDAIHTNRQAPKVAISGIKVRGAERLPDEDGALTLLFEENNVLFEFAVLDFANPATNRFRHRLKGIDHEWVYDGTTHSANYAALPPGNYVLELQGATADSPWTEETVVFHLTIQPPWYRSWLAFLFYFLACFSAIWGLFRYRVKMFRLEHAAKTNAQESLRMKEFEAVKNQFFANLAHELRTPLTVILGLSNRLKRDVKKEEIEENARNIAEQGNTLLTLTNQILDLAKLESRQFSLNLFNGNICHFVQHHVEALIPLAESKGLQLVIINEQPVIWMDFDPDQIIKILNNLIANAIRHSNQGGRIHISTALQQDANWLKLSVEDEGEGITADDLPHIFDRFYQSGKTVNSNGAAGLGLTLARDLVYSMGGEVSVDSTPGKGTSFTILLPIKNQAPRLNPPADPAPAQKEELRTQAPGVKSHLPLLLILEDSIAVADFLKLSLRDYYRLEIAENGEEGIVKALDLIPDLILTDLAMPKKDGFEVTSFLKNDQRTSHIPIVMLTAKVEQQDRLEGQRRGANAYLTKPFEAQELLLILQNLLHLQQQWKHRYTRFADTPQVLEEPDQVSEDLRMEDEFMQTLYAAFEENYQDDTFNLDRLCRILGMSSSQLDRKLKVLTDQSPMQMLRRYRLHKAQKLLQNYPRPSIKDVCYRTGFKSPSHFSRVFSETFGKPPSET